MIIDCAHFVAGGQDVVPVSLGDAGRLAGEAAGFVWVALSDPAADDLDELSTAFDLPHFAVQDTPEGYQRPKLEHHGESTILTVKTVRHDETGTQLEIGAVDVFVGARYAIAIGQSSPDALEGATERLRTRLELPRTGPWRRHGQCSRR
jgi:magnesium transporter